MLVISLIGQKGGTGKSTVIRCLASAGVARGKTAVILDCNPNQSSFQFTERLKKGDPISSRSVVGHACKSIPDLVHYLNYYNNTEKVDYAFIDTERKQAEWVDQIVNMSDRVVIPVLVSVTDITIQFHTYDYCRAAIESSNDNDNLAKIALLLNKVKPGRKYPAPLAAALEELTQHPALLDKYLFERNAYITTDTGILMKEWVRRLAAERLPYGYVSNALAESEGVLQAILDMDIAPEQASDPAPSTAPVPVAVPASTSAAASDTITMRLRIWLNAARRKEIENFFLAKGIKPSHLYRLASRNIQIIDADYDTAQSFGAAASSEDNVLSASIKIEGEIVNRWAAKHDPFQLMKPGELCRGAVCIAFDRAVTQIIEELS